MFGSLHTETAKPFDDRGKRTSNVYGLNQGERGDWAKDLDGVPIIDGSAPLDHEYLYWVGCAGSFDDRNKKTRRAMAKLLQRAVDFVGPHLIGGCHWSRDIAAAIIAAGFEIDQVRRFTFHPVFTNTPVAPHIVGRARRV